MTKQATPTVEALRGLTEFAWTAVTADCEEARVSLNERIEAARTALPAAEREAEVKAMLVTALQEALMELQGYHLEMYGEDYNNTMINAALTAATEGAE